MGGGGGLCPSVDGQVLFVRHQKPNGGYFIAQYAHIQNVPQGLRVMSFTFDGPEVRKGDVIAEVGVFAPCRNCSSPRCDHLHFGIWDSENQIPSSGWGYGRACYINPSGCWVDPMSFLGNAGDPPEQGTYSAAFHGQFPVYPPGYSYFELAPGSILNCYLDMKNTGTAIWTNDGSSPNYVELHSVNSSYTQDEASPLAYNWLGGSNVRMATTSGEVAANGGIGRYSFQIRAPSSPGTYRLRMKLYHPHASEFIPDGDAHVNLEVRVPEPPPPPPPPGIASDVLVYDWTERKVKAALFDGDDWKVDGTWYSGWQPGPSSDYRVFIADDTGDGDADVFLVWVPSGHWEQVYSNGDTFYRHRRLISSWMPNTPNNGRYQYFLGDVSGDGEVDAVVMNVSTGTASVAKGHYVSGGADTFEPQGNWVGGFCDGAIGRFQFMLGDVNGDGKADLVARELSSGRFRGARSTGTSFQAQSGYILSNWTATTDPNRYQVGLTDLDHDNQAELYAYKPASGTIYWANWTGSSFDARSPLITNWGTSSDPFRYKLLTGDLNRDGKSDFTLYKADGGNWYYGLSTGTSITNLATGLTSWGSDASRTRYTPLLGDVGLFHGSGGYSYSLPQTAERSEAALMTVSPNPVCGQSEIQLTLPAGSSADLRLYDASGREVTLVFSGQISTNPFRLAWDPRGSAGEKLKKGVYFLRLTRSSGAVSQKLVVLEP
ncbi:MAG: T9SS type A sorting domain-containing protein [bacterium]|nr:T9SS type A sorting domain-containing protein [bacterium]